jgi:hypothetical protein
VPKATRDRCVITSDGSLTATVKTNQWPSGALGAVSLVKTGCGVGGTVFRGP